MKNITIIIMAVIISVFSLHIDMLLQEKANIQEVNLMKSVRAEALDKEEEVCYNEITVEVTHYTHTGNNTASGVYPQAGVTVACNFLPIGTVIRLNGQEYVVQDTGSMEGLVVDVFVDTEDEAWERGRYTTTIEVVG